MRYTYDEHFNPVAGKLDSLIDLYTDYFGEKHRSKIDANLRNTEFFFLDKNPVETIKSLYNERLVELLDSYRKEIGMSSLSLTVEDLKHVLISVVVGDIGTEEFLKICEISALLGMNVFDYDDVDDFLSHSANANKLLAKLNKSIDLWHKKYESMYSDLIEEYSVYTERFVENQQALEDIDEYYENKIDHEYLEHLDKHLVNRDSISFQRFFTYKRLLQSAVAIGKDNLNSDFIVDKALQHQFMDFFGALGFYHGGDFDAFVQNPALQSILFDEELLDKIYSLKKEKYVTSFMHNEQFLDAVNKLGGFDSKSGSYNILASICMYLSSTHMGGFTQAHLTKDNRLKHYCVCPMGAGLSDNTFIHEAGHAAAGSIVQIMDNQFIDKSGIDTSTIDISPLEFSFDTLFDRVKVTNSHNGLKQTHRKYHILNEVIHDYMIQDILAMARARGLSFGLMSDDKVKTQYSFAFPMVRDFIERYKPFLKDCIMGDDPDMLARFMGQANLDTLADAVEKCVTLPENIRSHVMGEIMYHHDLDQESIFDIARAGGKWSKHTRAYLDLYNRVDAVYNSVQNRDGM